MEFGSLLFIFLFLPVALATRLLPAGMRVYLLVLISLFFYYVYAGGYVIVLLISIVLNYAFGILISKHKNEKMSGLILGTGITLNVMLLVFYKYSGFISRNLESLSGLNLDPVRPYLPSTFPVGISFFTFVAVSYLVDVHRNRKLVFTNPFTVAFTFSFFPKVLSGPITFHHKFFSELSGRGDGRDFEAGVKRFVYGLGKKILVADSLAGYADKVFLVPSGDLTFGLAWTGIIAFTLQIYIDFSGYTDMAIGLGGMLGFRLPENFNFPYISTSIRDFWKRWHITLSNWLQLYIFLPVAYRVMRKIRSDRKFGLKVEDIAYFSASLITMLVCGIWHGAEWTFLIWGMMHGFFLIIEHWKLGKFLRRNVWKPVQVLYAMLVVMIGWVIFRSPDMGYAASYMKSMVGFGSGTGSRYFVALFGDTEIVIAALAGVIISLPLRQWLGEVTGGIVSRHNSLMTLRPVRFAGETLKLIFFTMVFLASIMAVVGGSYSPFIYFGF
jgi:alginate O-acetyltransferase complex protein AlgI